MKTSILKARLRTFAVFALSASMISLISCEKENAPVQTSGISDKKDKKEFKHLDFYALCEDGKLLKYNTKNLKNPSASISISGLKSGQKIKAIDFRPATGQLYGLGNDSRIYVINHVSGAAHAIGSSPFTPGLDGMLAGFDFNPTVDRIRIVTENGQNLRVHPETGAVAFTDGIINGAPGASVTAVAYTDNRAGTSTTSLYDIDQTTGTLYKQNPPNNGSLEKVGSLGVSFSGEAGFDISSKEDVALAALYSGKKVSLYHIDLNSGAASKIDDFTNNKIVGIAIPTDPVAYAVDLENNLLVFNPENAVFVSKPITGIDAGEEIIGIDFRPATGQLYALGNSSKLYILNTASAAAALVGSGAFSTKLSGSSFGFDFNPVVDRIRIVSDNGLNLRVHPETGVVAFEDGNLNPGTPSISAAAYLNNFFGTTATSLFDIDFKSDKLYKQDPPNSGTLVEIGSLGLDIESGNGFDIGGTSNHAYGIFTCKDGTKLYSVDLMTGKAKAKISFSKSIRAFALGLGF